jgi:hypothetical protein
MYKINKGFIVQKLDDKTVIFDGDNSVLYTFNETASYIFKKLKTGQSEKEIITSLIKRYNIKEDRAKKDIKELIAELKKKKIINKV